MNRRMEFNNNIICRMSPLAHKEMTETELKKELQQKKEYSTKLREFIVEMSKKK